MLEIVEDGVVSEDGRPDMQRVLESLEKLDTIIQNLKLWAMKNM